MVLHRGSPSPPDIPLCAMGKLRHRAALEGRWGCNPLNPPTPRGAAPWRAGGSHPFPFKSGGLQGRRGGGSRPHVLIGTPSGGEEEGHGPVPARRGGPSAVSPGGGRGPRPRVPVPPALLRAAGRCQPRRGGTAGPGGGTTRRGHRSGSPGPPGAAGIGVSSREDAPHRARGAGRIVPWGCEVKWVGTSKPASRGGSNERKPRGTPRPCLSFPTLSTYPLKAPGAAGGCDPVCPLPHTHPTATATAASCWNGGPDGVGAIRPIPPTP